MNIVGFFVLVRNSGGVGMPHQVHCVGRRALRGHEQDSSGSTDALERVNRRIFAIAQFRFTAR